MTIKQSKRAVAYIILSGLVLWSVRFLVHLSLGKLMSPSLIPDMSFDKVSTIHWGMAFETMIVGGLIGFLVWYLREGSPNLE